MGLDSTHPLYTEFLPDWQQLRHCYGGERMVKLEGRAYLPATAGMVADGIETTNAKGWNQYTAYRARAVFPELLKSAVESMIGVMHHKPPVIELPAKLEPLRENATSRGESLEMLMRRVNEEQLVVGRVGLIADPIGPAAQLPSLAVYRAEDVVNWDDTIQPGTGSMFSMVVLNESRPERAKGDFSWSAVRQYRLLLLGSLDDESEVEPGQTVAVRPPGVYRAGTYRDDVTYTDDSLIEPSIAGRTLDRIPFVAINSKDVVPEPDVPPLLGLSNLSLTIYRGEADYRQALFMQGQDTLVVLGGEQDQEYRTGAGAAITPPIGGDAKYIGVDSGGLPEMRLALENDYERANQKAGEMVNDSSRTAESGEALRIRVAARTATLNQIALAGAYGLEQILRTCAVWVGANPDEVVVTPNLDFIDDVIQGQELVQIMTAKGLGAPISLESIHLTMQDRGLTEKSWEDELKAIEGEMGLELGSPASTNPDGPEVDEDPEDEGDEAA